MSNELHLSLMYIYVADATRFMQYNVYTRVRKEYTFNILFS